MSFKSLALIHLIHVRTHTLGCCFTGLGPVFLELLQVRLAQKVIFLGIATAVFLQVEGSSCHHPTRFMLDRRQVSLHQRRSGYWHLGGLGLQFCRPQK